MFLASGYSIISIVEHFLELLYCMFPWGSMLWLWYHWGQCSSSTCHFCGGSGLLRSVDTRLLIYLNLLWTTKLDCCVWRRRAPESKLLYKWMCAIVRTYLLVFVLTPFATIPWIRHFGFVGPSTFVWTLSIYNWVLHKCFFFFTWP